MKVTFGNLPSVGWKDGTARLVDLAVQAEAAGFARYGVSDWKFYQDCFVVMTACLTATKTLELESLVTEPYVRNPAVTAAAIAAMDDLSSGRAVLGIGPGVESSSRVWTSPWGFERPHPVDAVREAVDVTRRMWRGEEVTLQGKVVRVEKARLSFATRADIPICIAARSPRMQRLAGELADIAHLATFYQSVPWLKGIIANIQKGADRAGRAKGTYEIDLSMPCSLSRDRRAARQAAKRLAAIGISWAAAADEYALKNWTRPADFDVPEDLVRAISKWNFRKQLELPQEIADAITDDILDDFALAGDPEECAGRILELQMKLPEITGIRIYAVPPVPGGVPGYSGYASMMDDCKTMIDIVNRGQRSN
ncbi:MAG TPA: LLM class flavin-dependent oxidoreductase [Candidatus Limnocylindria bacterium]|jgi:5,10-methylenetetrahydromethanopterin reductase